MQILGLPRCRLVFDGVKFKGDEMLQRWNMKFGCTDLERLTVLVELFEDVRIHKHHVDILPERIVRLKPRESLLTMDFSITEPTQKSRHVDKRGIRDDEVHVERLPGNAVGVNGERTNQQCTNIMVLEIVPESFKRM